MKALYFIPLFIVMWISFAIPEIFNLSIVGKWYGLPYVYTCLAAWVGVFWWTMEKVWL